MPPAFKKQKIQPRGVSNRRAALRWIRSNVHEGKPIFFFLQICLEKFTEKNALTGVLYFGDDDNTYDLRLFNEIRDTKNVSVFPVGLIGDYAVSAPVVRDVRTLVYNLN